MRWWRTLENRSRFEASLASAGEGLSSEDMDPASASLHEVKFLRRL
jgi:hypothetical protein